LGRTRDRNKTNSNANRQPRSELNAEDLAYEASRRVNERYADARSRIDATLDDTNVSREVDDLNISDRIELIENAGFGKTPVQVVPSDAIDGLFEKNIQRKRGDSSKKTFSRLLN